MVDLLPYNLQNMDVEKKEEASERVQVVLSVLKVKKKMSDDVEEKEDEYKGGKKLTMEEISKLDNQDESLKRYKEQLLGNALAGKDDVNDPRKLVIVSFGLVFPDKEHPDVTFPLDSQEAIEKLKTSVISIKEGVNYCFECKFRVQHDIISALKFVNTISRGGIKLDKKSHVMGSYGPEANVKTWKSQVQTAPSGLLARGTYKAQTQFLDDDKTNHLDLQYQLAIKSDWDKK